MQPESKIVKAESIEEVLDNEKLRAELTYAMLENKRTKRLIDLFILMLFLVFIMYTSI